MGRLNALLQERGYRSTVQREIILDAFESLSGHITAEDVYAKVREAFPQVNISTVYLTLELLEHEALAVHTQFHDGLIKWHRTEESRHHHLVCRICGAEQELAHPVVDAFASQIRAQTGFELDRGHLALAGLCKACAERDRSGDD
jgi:Fur family ferric uptake transcriptional regulator